MIVSYRCWILAPALFLLVAFEPTSKKANTKKRTTTLTPKQMADKISEDIRDLITWYQTEIAAASTREKNPAEIKSQLENLAAEFQIRMNAINAEYIARYPHFRELRPSHSPKFTDQGSTKIAVDQMLDHANPVQQKVGLKTFLDERGGERPGGWLTAARYFWDHGEKQRAAFCFFVGDLSMGTERISDRYISIRAALENQIRNWIGSDPDFWYALALQAKVYFDVLDYERSRPQNISKEIWEARIKQTKQRYLDKLNAELGTAALRQALKSKRIKDGLPVGPLKDLGSPLTEIWLRAGKN